MIENYNVLVVGYKNCDLEKIADLIKFEKSYLVNSCNNNHDILIFSYVIMHETKTINEKKLKKYRKGREEYNVSCDTIGATGYDCNCILKYNLAINFE